MKWPFWGLICKYQGWVAKDKLPYRDLVSDTDGTHTESTHRHIPTVTQWEKHSHRRAHTHIQRYINRVYFRRSYDLLMLVSGLVHCGRMLNSWHNSLLIWTLGCQCHLNSLICYDDRFGITLWKKEYIVDWILKCAKSATAPRCLKPSTLSTCQVTRWPVMFEGV